MKNNWQTKKLGELFDFKNGRSFQKSEWRDAGVPIIRIQNLNSDTSGFNYFEGPYDKNIEINNGNLLFSWSGTVGSSFGPHIWNNGKGVLNQHIFKVNFKDNMDLIYAYYGLRYITEEVEKKVNGAVGLVHITKEKLNEFTIIYPELSEQKKIAKFLNEVFEKVEIAKENTEKNLQNSSELFESYLQNAFENKTHNIKLFEDVCELVGGSQPSKQNFTYFPSQGYVRLIQVRDYRTDKFTTYIPKEMAKRYCTVDDILIGRYGPPIFGIFKGIEGAYNVALMKAVVNLKICNRKYFYWFLKTNNLREYVELSSKRAAGQDGVRKELLAKYPVPLPSLDEQHEIVQNIEIMFGKTKKLEEKYRKKLADLEELKKSILQQAFNPDSEFNNKMQFPGIEQV